GQHDQGGTQMPYMALELVEGGTLAARLRGMPHPLRTAAALVEALARAVDYAHERGIVHRDLKPANILLAVGSGQSAVGSENEDPSSLPTADCPLPTVPKIADFGLAKRREEQATRHTGTGVVLGTAQYMAPEQAAGRSALVGP